MSLLTLVVVLVEKGPDPAKVKPGWLGLFVFLALFAATVLLWLSMRRHLRRADRTFGERDDHDAAQDSPPGRS